MAKAWYLIGIVAPIYVVCFGILSLTPYAQLFHKAKRKYPVWFQVFTLFVTVSNSFLAFLYGAFGVILLIFTAFSVNRSMAEKPFYNTEYIPGIIFIFGSLLCCGVMTIALLYSLNISGKLIWKTKTSKTVNQRLYGLLKLNMVILALLPLILIYLHYNEFTSFSKIVQHFHEPSRPFVRFWNTPQSTEQDIFGSEQEDSGN